MGLLLNAMRSFSRTGIKRVGRWNTVRGTEIFLGRQVGVLGWVAVVVVLCVARAVWLLPAVGSYLRPPVSYWLARVGWGVLRWVPSSAVCLALLGWAIA